MICKNCGKEFPVGSFCPACGTKYNEIDAEPVANDREESQSRNQIDSGLLSQEMSPYQGNIPFQQTAYIINEPYSPKKKPNTIVIIILVVLAVILSIVIFLAILGSLLKGKDSSNDSSTVSNASQDEIMPLPIDDEIEDKEEADIAPVNQGNNIEGVDVTTLNTTLDMPLVDIDYSAVCNSALSKYLDEGINTVYTYTDYTSMHQDFMDLDYFDIGLYTLSTFPYYFSDARDLIPLIKKASEAKPDDFIEVYHTPEGYSTEYPEEYARESPRDYIDFGQGYLYYGELKDGKPNGKGMILKNDAYLDSFYSVTIPRVVGNFRNGYLDGYAISCNDSFNTLSYGICSECYYVNGKRDGYCVEYSYIVPNERERNDDLIFVDESVSAVTAIPSLMFDNVLHNIAKERDLIEKDRELDLIEKERDLIEKDRDLIEKERDLNEDRLFSTLKPELIDQPLVPTEPVKYVFYFVGDRTQEREVYTSYPEEDTIKANDIVTETSDYDSSDSATSEEYVLEGSDTGLVGREYLEKLTDEELWLARNEIYARHGRRFNSEDLQVYFESKSWYTPVYTPEEFDAQQESILNSYEKTNRDLIVEIEAERKQ